MRSSRARRAPGRYDECLRWLHQGVVLALIVSPVVMLVTWIAFQTIDAWGLNPQIGALAKPYLAVNCAERGAADFLFGLPPLPAGHPRRAAHHVTRSRRRTW